MTRFCRYVLRTTDVAAAQAFYARVFGGRFIGAEVEPLPAAAAARGAPAHWLGYLGIGDAEVEDAADAFVARGATRLGPPRPMAGGEGAAAALLRDPGGAVVALTRASPATMPSGVEVAWHELNTTDVARAMADYGALFGWWFPERRAAEDADGGGAAGVVQVRFAFEPGGPLAGSILGTVGRPSVHPHWLFHFRVAAFDSALDAVRDGGGVVAGQFDLARGERVAVCDDPQGAAFAIRACGAAP